MKFLCTDPESREAVTIRILSKLTGIKTDFLFLFLFITTYESSTKLQVDGYRRYDCSAIRAEEGAGRSGTGVSRRAHIGRAAIADIALGPADDDFKLRHRRGHRHGTGSLDMHNHGPLPGRNSREIPTRL